ncbi:MAG TPA: hypothetical protein VEA37_07015, partial [Flavobacterium sp.]|nr:hypothetical protein [Flavobacterium sp.]
SGQFYSSPSVQLSSTYYFRAVGFFNDNPEKKFYGGISSFSTVFPRPGNPSLPFTVEFEPAPPIEGEPVEFPEGTMIPYNPPPCDPATQEPEPVNGLCVNKATNGGWTGWSFWSPCSATACSSTGTQTSTRTCTYPPPANGGADCSGLDGGNATRERSCTTPACPLVPPPTGPGYPSIPIPGYPGGTTTVPPSDEVYEGGLVKCGTLKYREGEQLDDNNRDMVGQIKNPCDFNAFMRLINDVINFLLIYMALPIMAIMFAYAGFLLVTAGGEAAHAKTKAKKIFFNAILGFIIAAGAWLFVKIPLFFIGYKDIDLFFDIM